jgi:hypothetical protein
MHTHDDETKYAGAGGGGGVTNMATPATSCDKLKDRIILLHVYSFFCL